MIFPPELLYTKDHEWLRIEGDHAVVGITDFAQRELGDIVFIDIPLYGNKVGKGEVFGTVEAVKTVSDLFMPVSGVIEEVNSKLNDQPDAVNTSPYEEGWIVKIKLAAPAETSELLDAASYKNLVA